MTVQPTVLIIDDDRMTRAALDALLSTQNWNLVFAVNGTEGLDKASTCDPDVILLDVMMPGIDGFQVCKRLRASPQSAQVPILLITALDDADSRLTGFEAGADDFINKPFDRTELRARVQNTLKLNRYRRLIAERNKFEWVVDRAPDGYLVLDDDDRIVYANPSARAFLGLPDDAIVIDSGSVPRFLQYAERQYRREPEECWASWPEPSSIVESPLYLVRPESASAAASWLQVTVLDVSGESGPNRLIRLSDVTGQVVNGRDLWAASSAIMHKLNTPLSLQLGSLELLASVLKPGGSTDIAEMVGVALRSAQRLRDEIDQVMQYVDSTGARQRDHLTGLDRLPFFLAGSAKDHGIPEPRLNASVDLDRLQVPFSAQALELIVNELVRNSKKFHPDRSPTLDVDVSALPSGETRVRVCDDGIWLPPEQLARSWWPFWQGERRFTGQPAGMGLGLPLVASLLWESGGRCSLKNRPDRPGVCAELIFPCSIPDDAGE